MVLWSAEVFSTALTGRDSNVNSDQPVMASASPSEAELAGLHFPPCLGRHGQSTQIPSAGLISHACMATGLENENPCS